LLTFICITLTVTTVIILEVETIRKLLTEDPVLDDSLLEIIEMPIEGTHDYILETEINDKLTTNYRG
jgi:hypothetical protein